MRQGGARNVALAYATGEYLAFVDADDFVAEDFLEKVYARAKQKDADIVQFEYYYYTEQLGAVANGRQIQDENIQIATEEQRKQFLVGEKITYGCWNKLYRRKLVEQANVHYAEHVIYEEPLFVYPQLFYGTHFEVMSEPFYYYRQNEGGTMRSDMRQVNTLLMHADVQLAVWKFMKETSFFDTFYEEIKLYFLHTYLYETILFSVQRGFGLSDEVVNHLTAVVKTEVPQYWESPYSSIIPRQMELYRMIRNGYAAEKLLEFFEEV